MGVYDAREGFAEVHRLQRHMMVTFPLDLLALGLIDLAGKEVEIPSHIDLDLVELSYTLMTCNADEIGAPTLGRLPLTATFWASRIRKTSMVGILKP